MNTNYIKKEIKKMTLEKFKALIVLAKKQGLNIRTIAEFAIFANSASIA